MTAYQRAKAAGWTIRRGSYHGTTDDRADRWYADRDDGDTLDRRGPGHPTREAAAQSALDAEAWQKSMDPDA